VTVGDPVRTIPAAETGGEPIDAPGDRAFRPVEVAYRDLDGVPYDAPQSATVRPEELTRLALVIDGTAYPVRFTGASSATSYVTVARGGASDPALRVEFDGVTQEVDAAGRRDTGAAAGLYRASTRTLLASCGRSEVRRCDYDLWEYPWVEGLGWASARRPGATWVVALVQTWLRADRIRSGAAVCDADDLTGELAVTVDGARADERLDAPHPTYRGQPELAARGAYLLPPAAEHRLEVTSRWSCRFGDTSVARTVVDRARVR
jgi:hypothetical protein